MKLRIKEAFWGINRKSGERSVRQTDMKIFEPVIGSVMEFPTGRRRFTIDAADENSITVTVHYENTANNKTWIINAGESQFYRPRSMDGGYQYDIFYGSSAMRIIALMKEIEERKEHEYAATTYKDIPALREIDEILKAEYLSEKPYTRDTLLDSIVAVRYLANAYEFMWRIAYAVKYYNLLLELENELYRSFGELDQNLADDYYTALRARNYYRKDNCTDLSELVKDLLPEDKRANIEKQILVDWTPLKHDPVELTDEYLSVIDEVERRMDTEEIRTMHHFQRSEIFEKLLSEYGVRWVPITKLNPNMHFD